MRSVTTCRVHKIIQFLFQEQRYRGPSFFKHAGFLSSAPSITPEHKVIVNDFRYLNLDEAVRLIDKFILSKDPRTNRDPYSKVFYILRVPTLVKSKERLVGRVNKILDAICYEDTFWK